MEDHHADSVKSVKTRIRRGDVVSTHGAIVQILKFEGGKIIGIHVVPFHKSTTTFKQLNFFFLKIYLHAKIGHFV